MKEKPDFKANFISSEWMKKVMRWSKNELAGHLGECLQENSRLKARIEELEKAITDTFRG